VRNKAFTVESGLMTDEQIEQYVDSRLNSIREEITQHFDSRVQETQTEIEERVHEIQAEIDELRRSRVPAVSPDSDLLSRLDEAEIRLQALIQSLVELLPAKDLREKFSATYKAIKRKRQQEEDAASRELLAWFEQEDE
jgi:AAA+ ATPase superfamily predicted ATPase